MVQITNNIGVRVPLMPGTCEVCGKPCELNDATCSLACEGTLMRREQKQGAQVIRVLKRWRKHRGRKGTPGEGALTEAVVLIDAMLKADRIDREVRTAARKAEQERKEADAMSAPTTE